MAAVQQPTPSASTSTIVNTSLPPVAPPTPQEVTRKLSMSVPTRPVKAQTSTSTLAPSPITSSQQHHQVSGTESDSDSFLSPPDHSPLTTQTPLSQQSHGHYPGGATLSLAASTSTQPLSSIAERVSGSGDESEEDDYEDQDPEHDEEHLQLPNKQGRVAEDSIIKSGYLWKKGERRKTWKKRWFVLRTAQLAFYKSSAEYQLLRLLDLADVHCCTPVELKRHPHAFGLVSPARTYYLYASSEDEMRDWVSAINGAREALVGTSTQNSISTPPIPIPKNGGGASGSRSGVAVTSGLTPSPPSHRGQAHPVTSESDSEDGLVGSFNAATTLGTSPMKSNQAHAQKDPTKAVISGYLMKCRSKRRGWRKRWFVLTGEKLMYMANHMDTKRVRSIELNQILDALEYDLSKVRHHSNGITASSPPHHVLSHSPHNTIVQPSSANHLITDDSHQGEAHAFKIVTTKRSLLLSAPSEEEEIQWLSAVRALIARRSGQAGANVSGATNANANAGGQQPAASVNTSVGTARGLVQASVNTNAASMPIATGADVHGHAQSGSGTTLGSGSKISGRRRSASGNSAHALMNAVGSLVGSSS